MDILVEGIVLHKFGIQNAVRRVVGPEMRMKKLQILHGFIKDGISLEEEEVAENILG
jgi:hypothetical protein